MKYVFNQAELLLLIVYPTKQIPIFINDDLIVVDYGDGQYFICYCSLTNVLITTFRTCLARLKLLDVGERALYSDTDSFMEDPSCSDVHMGVYFGHLTDGF